MQIGCLSNRYGDHMNRSLLYLSLLGAACAASCVSAEDADESEETGEASQDMISLNGTSLTGISTTGTTPGGSSLAGTTLTKVSTAGTSRSGTSLVASSTTAAPWTGAVFTGSTWNGTMANGAAVKLRVDSAVVATAPNAELWFYAVSYQTATAWTPLCGLDGAGQPIRAIAVAGLWSAVNGDAASYGPSSTQFTLACRTKTIAKCVELGYKTYKGFTNQMTSCVRALRGDYCGTGVSYTVEGTTLNLYDRVGLQADNQAWAPEAEWTSRGARCIHSNNTARYQLVRARDPQCVEPLQTTSCGTSFANGAILISELNSSQ